MSPIITDIVHTKARQVLDQPHTVARPIRYRDHTVQYT